MFMFFVLCNVFSRKTTENKGTEGGTHSLGFGIDQSFENSNGTPFVLGDPRHFETAVRMRMRSAGRNYFTSKITGCVRDGISL